MTMHHHNVGGDQQIKNNVSIHVYTCVCVCVCVNFFLLGHKPLVGNVLVKRYFESNYQGVGQVAVGQGWGGGGGGGNRSNQKANV